MKNPEAGDIIQGTGGLRKLWFIVINAVEKVSGAAFALFIIGGKGSTNFGYLLFTTKMK